MRKRPKASGLLASMTERRVNWPESSAIAVVSAWKVEPISKVAAAMRLMRSGFSASTGRFGSKSG
ncbi:hypothetical protein D9M70_644440 [compost metagenome]